jgi:2-polyprenyl-6-methoxyphenol hydroxylase-like FAD-dependent oxidoreductase
MAVVRTFALAVAMAAIVAGSAGSALAQACTRAGVDVTCDDGRRGVFSGDAIIWADGTRSSLASPHPGVIVGNKSSVIVGQGVFVGQGKGVVPMENPSDPRRARCPVLEGVAYCY